MAKTARRSRSGRQTARVTAKRAAGARLRRAAAVKGWQTRRAAQQRRSEAARKGWKTRKKNIRRKKRERVSIGKSPVRDWMMTFSYRGKGMTRQLDFLIEHATEDQTGAAVSRFIARTEDLHWTRRVPWDDEPVLIDLGVSTQASRVRVSLR